MITQAGGPWTTRALLQLIWPLVVDRVLVVTMGVADTIMVASLGEAAVGGVSLVDSIAVLLIEVFASLTTGGAVVASQYLGRGDRENASESARELLWLCLLISAGITLASLAARRPLLRLIYGHIEADVMRAAETYFFYILLSFPALALYTAGAALFRSMGNSTVGMWISLLVNILNIGGNALGIYVLRMGVAGAAAATLASRVIAAAVILALLWAYKDNPITIRGISRFRLRRDMARSIFRIALPSTVEGSMFQFGKLALARLVSVFGTAAIAGNAVATIMMTLGNLPGLAVAQALLVVVGQSMGAGDTASAKKYTARLIRMNYAVMSVFNIFLIAIMPVFFRVFALSPESIHIARVCGTIFCAAAVLIWIPAYCLPFALRAAGDANYTMIVSALAMWLLRVGVAYVLAYGFGVGVVCVWISMVCEWTARGSCFTFRWLTGGWKTKKVI